MILQKNFKRLIIRALKSWFLQGLLNKDELFICQIENSRTSLRLNDLYSNKCLVDLKK